jgi:hypothetical protein
MKKTLLILGLSMVLLIGFSCTPEALQEAVPVACCDNGGDIPPPPPPPPPKPPGIGDGD